jgi:hypothetical protein
MATIGFSKVRFSFFFMTNKGVFKRKIMVKIFQFQACFGEEFFFLKKVFEKK